MSIFLLFPYNTCEIRLPILFNLFYPFKELSIWRYRVSSSLSTGIIGVENKLKDQFLGGGGRGEGGRGEGGRYRLENHMSNGLITCDMDYPL